MSAIEQLLNSFDITSIIFYIFLFFFAFKGAFEVSEYFYNKIKNFFTNKSSAQMNLEEIKDNIEEISSELELAKLSMQAYGEDIEDLKKMIEKDEQYIIDEIRLVFKNRHHKYMELGMIDDFALDDLEKKYAYYTAKGGNGYVKTLFDDIRGLKVVDAAEVEKRRKELRGKEESDA